MAAVKELALAIQEMAHEMRDDFGEDPNTVVLIARHFKVSPEFVEQALALE